MATPPLLAASSDFHSSPPSSSREGTPAYDGHGWAAGIPSVLGSRSSRGAGQDWKDCENRNPFAIDVNDRRPLAECASPPFERYSSFPGCESPSTPKRWSSNPVTDLTPSKFIVKGTVTPSRAAPLFVRFTSSRRGLSRVQFRDEETASSDDEEESEGEDEEMQFHLGPLPSSNVEEPAGKARERGKKSAFISRDDRMCDMPRMAFPTSSSFRPLVATRDTASYLLALRSNSLASLPWASSARGAVGGSAGRGVLGVSRMLGAGLTPTNVSHRPFHSTFTSDSNLGMNVFELSSSSSEGESAHPLCAEYAHSSRSLDNHYAQWLAVGDNEGRLHLLNTLSDPMSSIEGGQEQQKRDWQACAGSVFEVNWRFDDQMIASGGSDYCVRVWSAESGAMLRTFSGHRGSPRSIAWDPHGSGSTLVSGGRDGAIHMYDLRIKDGYRDGETWSPCLSIWDAHVAQEPPRPLRGPGSRGGVGGGGARLKQPKAVTSIAYLPGRGSHLLVSAGCVDAKVKLWDMRRLETHNATSTNPSARGRSRQTKARPERIVAPEPLEQGIDVTRGAYHSSSVSNKSSHGISSLVVGADKVFAACTDGRIYTINAADFFQPSMTSSGHPIPPLYHDAQRGNTLFSRLALHDNNRTLALGCNTGAITVWDTHAASLALSEIYSSHDGGLGDERPDEEAVFSAARPALLQDGHSAHFEVNSVSWAHGTRGPTLASVSDDFTIRTWHANQDAANSECR